MKSLHKLVLAAFGAIGVFGCDQFNSPQPEYACPYADYSLSGTVIDADSAKAIGGIEITFNCAKAHTAPDGTWRIDCRPACSWQDSLWVADVDGETNRGEFAPDSLALSPERILPSKGWYLGSFVQRDIHITVRKKTPGAND